uniref:Junctional adhesion molecule A n=1 Tax=Varanus komodoensis TaxID=61221 RepID=A0A8D2IXZ6_VARKO
MPCPIREGAGSPPGQRCPPAAFCNSQAAPQTSRTPAPSIPGHWPYWLALVHAGAQAIRGCSPKPRGCLGPFAPGRSMTREASEPPAQIQPDLFLLLADAYKDRVTFFSNEILFKSVTRKDSGRYTCMVLGNTFDESVVDLVVQVPPSKPKAQVPSVVTIGSKAVLSCVETDGNPRPTFKWFRNNSEMPSDPKSNSLFRNSSYVLDSSTGVLTFNPATAFDAGEYYCVAENKVGAPQKSDTVQMQTSNACTGSLLSFKECLHQLRAFGLAWRSFSLSKSESSKVGRINEHGRLYPAHRP